MLNYAMNGNIDLLKGISNLILKLNIEVSKEVQLKIMN